MDLKDKKALVTGGAEGIGYGIAEALREEGADVVITGRREDALAEAASRLGAGFIQADVGIEQDVERTMGEFIDLHGRIDILVNNAGFGIFAPLVEMDFRDLQSVFRTNVFGAFLMGRAAARQMIEQKSGHIINIASTSGLKGGQRSTAYSGSKFALRGMTDCWRDELRRHDIRVMLVNPSEVQTEFFSKVGFEQKRSEKKLRPREIADAIVGALKVDDRGFIPEFSVFATNPF